VWPTLLFPVELICINHKVGRLKSVVKVLQMHFTLSKNPLVLEIFFLPSKRRLAVVLASLSDAVEQFVCVSSPRSNQNAANLCPLSRTEKGPAINWAKVLLGKSCHSATILATPPGSYFGLTRPGSYLNEWAECQNCTFSGHRDIKTACIETAVKYDKNR